MSAAPVAVAVGSGILLGLLVRSGLRAHESNVALWQRAESLDAECRRLEARQAALAAEAYALDHDPVYVERRIREDGRVVNAGEIVIERTGGH